MIKMLLMTSLVGSVISLVLVLFKARLVKRFGGAWFYYACLLSLALFVLPVRVNVSGLLPQSIVVAERAPLQQAAITGTSAPATAATGQAAAARIAVNNQLPLLPDTEQCLLVIWAAGVVLMLGRYLWGYARFKKQVTQNSPIAKVANLDVVASGYVHSPLLIGFFRPKIVMPEVEISACDYQLALRHELTHHTQKDAWCKLAAVLVNSLHWFNPVTYFLVENISEACEYACDERVTRGMEWDEKKRYSDMILNFAAQASPALGSSLARNRRQLFRRFELIMNTGAKNRRLLGIGLATMMAVLTAGSVMATSAVLADQLPPLTELNGGIYTWYDYGGYMNLKTASWYNLTLEDNVDFALGIPNPHFGIIGTTGPSGITYIDANGRKIAVYNRTTPCYGVELGWIAKNSPDLATMTIKTLSILDTEVTVAFAGDDAAYRDDPVIDKMIRNQITFEELGYRPTQYNHQAFINELISRGAYLIKQVVTPENFKPEVWYAENGDFVGMKILTKFDQKTKIADVLNQRVVIPKNIDGHQGVQIGNNFVIDSGQSLAIDVKETTDKMPQVSLALTDVTTGEPAIYCIPRALGGLWFPGATGGYRYIYTPRPALAGHTFKVAMSTEEASDTAATEIFTYRTEADDTASQGHALVIK